MLIDALAEVGGQCAALYPEKPIYDIPAHPAIDAGELVTRLEQQIAPFTPPRLLARRVVGLSGEPRAFMLTTDAGDVVRARAVLVAAGAGAFGPNRPPLDGLAAYEASGAVQYYVRRREDFRGKRVVIAGGGDLAVDWALALKDIARIAMVHRRAKFRAAPESAAQLEAAARNGEIDLVVPYQLHALHGADGALREVEVATLEGQTRRLGADVLLPFFGLSMDLGPIAAWGLDRELHHVKVDPATCRRRCRACSPSATWRPIREAETDPARLQRGGDRRARDLPCGAAGRGAALRIFDDEWRAGRGLAARRRSCAQLV